MVGSGVRLGCILIWTLPLLVVEAGFVGAPHARCLSPPLQPPGNWGNLGLGGAEFEKS